MRRSLHAENFTLWAWKGIFTEVQQKPCGQVHPEDTVSVALDAFEPRALTSTLVTWWTFSRFSQTLFAHRCTKNVCVCVFCSNIWLPYKVIIWVLHIKNMVMLHLTMWYVTLIAIMTKLQIINKPPYVFCFIKQNISCQSFIDKPKNIHSCRHIGSPALKRELWASNTMVIYKKQQCFII